MRPYPTIFSSDNAALKQALDFIGRERQADVQEFNNLPNVFITGRKVGKIPSASADVVATDRPGDFSYDASFIYICLNNAGTVVWRRATLGSW